MPKERHAHLFLPSPLGLLEYDVLEETVFIGPGPRKTLRAQPSPFPEAVLILSRTGQGFVARAMPGEPAPDVNGAPSTDKPLADGDRLRIAEQVVLFRTDTPAVTVPAKAQPSPTNTARTSSNSESRRAAVRPAKASGLNTAISLAGAALLLVAAVRAVGHLQGMQKEKGTRGALPNPPVVGELTQDRRTRELEAIYAHERAHPLSARKTADRYRAFIERHAGESLVDAAQERLRELMEEWARRERALVGETVERQIESSQFLPALTEVRNFEARFGATRAGQDIESLKIPVLEAARASYAKLRKAALALLETNPQQAERMLMGASSAYPLEIVAEMTTLAVAARRRAESNVRRGVTPRRGPLRDKPKPPVDNGQPGPTPPPTPPPTDEGGREKPPRTPAQIAAEAKQLWKDAREALGASRYTDARGAYILLLQRFADQPLIKTNLKRIRAGLYAAQVGEKGPMGLLSVEAEYQGKKLHVEYQFNDADSWEKDFTHEQPFASEHPVDMELKMGKVSMAGTSGMMHRLVFLDDVRIEAIITADAAHDFGLIAMEESDKYRAVLFNVNNKRFSLKKGAAARPNPGHLLWYIGQGVWKDADADMHGYIKIAERSRSKVQDGEEVRLDLERRSRNRCEASMASKSDGVSLKGDVVGDDKSTMGPARVGIFTNTGLIRVHSLKITGTVDPDWFREEVQILAAADPGPQ